MKRKFVPMLLILIVIVVILTFMDYRESAQNAAETEASRTELSAAHDALERLRDEYVSL